MTNLMEGKSEKEDYYSKHEHIMVKDTTAA
jgi:hypothetical protein